jgi:cell division protein FtsL
VSPAATLRRLKRAMPKPRLTGGIPSSLHARGLIFWAAALATGLTCVWEHVHSSELAGDIDELRAKKEDVLAEIGFLNMECAELSSRERIEQEAGAKLGMRYPAEGEVVWLRPDGCRVWTRNDYVEAAGDDRSGG